MNRCERVQVDDSSHLRSMKQSEAVVYANNFLHQPNGTHLLQTKDYLCYQNVTARLPIQQHHCILIFQPAKIEKVVIFLTVLLPTFSLCTRFGEENSAFVCKIDFFINIYVSTTVVVVVEKLRCHRCVLTAIPIPCRTNVVQKCWVF